MPARNLSLSSKRVAIFSEGGRGSGHKQEASRRTVLRPQLSALVSFETSLTREVVVLVIYLNACDKKNYGAVPCQHVGGIGERGMFYLQVLNSLWEYMFSQISLLYHICHNHYQRILAFLFFF